MTRVKAMAASAAGLREPPYTLRDLLTVLFRDWKIIARTLVVVMAMGGAVSLLLPVQFTAESRVMVLPSQDYVLQPDVGNLPMGLALGQDQMVRGEMEILKNGQLIEQVVRDVGLERLFPGMDKGGLLVRMGLMPPKDADQAKTLAQAAIAFTDALEVQPVKDSNVLYLTFTHKDPVVAADALNGLLFSYLDYRRTIFAQQRSRLFATQRDSFGQRLSEVEKEIEQFKQANDISSFPDQKALLLRQHAEMVNDRLVTQTRLREVEARLATLQDSLKKTPAVIQLYSDSIQEDSRDTARSTLVTLEMRRAELLTKFREDSRYVTDLDRQIAELRDIIVKSPPKGSENRRVGRNAAYDDLTNEIVRLAGEADALRERSASLEGQVGQMEQRLSQFDHIERQYNELTLQRNLIEQNYRTYAQKVEEAQIMEEMDRQKTANVRVIEQAKPPAEGKGLRSLVLLLSLIGGSVLAVGLVFALDYSRDIMLTPESVERSLRLPVLVAVAAKAPPGAAGHAGRR